MIRALLIGLLALGVLLLVLLAGAADAQPASAYTGGGVAASGGSDKCYRRDCTVASLEVGSSVANKLDVSGGAAAAPVILEATGSDTNITVRIQPKGTGRTEFNSSGGIRIGNGTTTDITSAPAGQVIVDFASVAANTCSTTTQGAAGVVAGDPLAYSATAALPAGFIYFLTATGAATIEIRGCNVTTGAVDPPNVFINWRAIKS